MSEVIPYFLPTQLAIILGTSVNNIREWVECGILKSEKKDDRVRITPKQIALFLLHHPEEIGRIYCDDLIPVFNEARKQIVDILENLREDERYCLDTLLSKYPH